MRPKLHLLVIFCLASQLSAAQKAAGAFSETEKRNLATVNSAVHFLKTRISPGLKAMNAAKDWTPYAVYDTLVNKYFDLSYLRDSLEKDGSDSLEQRVYLQKRFLYNIDHYLDFLPADSIYITPLRHTEQADQSAAYPANSLVVYFLLNNHQFPVNIMLFSKEGKLFAASPLLHFGKDKKSLDMEAFFRRQKGYELSKEQLWTPTIDNE